LTNTFYKYFPALAFAILWFVIFYLHHLSLYNLRSVSNATWLTIFTAVSFFLLSYFIAVIYDKNSRTLFHSKPRLQINQPLLLKLLLAFTLILFIGGSLRFIAIGNQLGGLEVFINRPLMVRQEIVNIQMGYSPVPLLFRLGGYLTSIGFISIIIGGITIATSSKFRLLGILPIFVLAYAQLGTMGRYFFITGVCFYFTSFIITTFFLPKNDQRKKLFEVFAYSIVMFVGVLVMSYYIIKFRSPLADDIFALLKESVYLYFTGGVTALDYALFRDESSRLFGQSSFRSLYNWFYRFGLVSEEEVIRVHNVFVSISPTYNMNTYTFVRSLVYDFGLTGLMIFSSIWGFLTKFFLYKAYRKYSMINLLVASVFVFSLFISFFSFYFQALSTIIFWLITVYIVDYFYGHKIFTVKYN